MTFPTIRLSFPTFFRRTTEPAKKMHADNHTDSRREYLNNLLAANACVGEYGAQALMGHFPKDF